MRARLGPKQAIVATAHKIARTVYQLLKTGEPYREESAAAYDHIRRERERRELERRAQKLGYTLSRAKTNIGLGRITNAAAAQPQVAAVKQ